MHQPRGRDRRPARRAGSVPAGRPAAPVAVSGARVVTVGYFSAKEKNPVALMDAADTELTARGARIVGRIVQRRGVSAGGVGKMALPYSSRTLLSRGKVRELAEACEATDADLVVFVAALTEHQQRVLTGVLGRPAVCLSAVLTAV
ncbi:hypothetical protein [Streptomyces sp. NPDC058718]|uniref:HflX-like GTP-binding protein n=1 Tax=Streptomyces sp. NPDC058718 TaxID=3346610 RepID=UPI00369C988C